jgi:serine/threonine protein kinase
LSGSENPICGLDRASLASRTRSVLHRGNWGNPDVLLVESDEGPVVVKDFAPRGRLVRRWLGPWLLDREQSAYRELSGVEAVPTLVGRLDPRALVIEYRPGILLSRSLAGRLPADFLRDLEAAVDAMHGRGVVHLDLRHRSNILAGADGRPVLIDFASALRFDARTRLGRGLVRLVGRIDRRALEKWRVRLV